VKVVVIGAGILGAAIAFRLSQRQSVEVTVIDRAAAGSGATGHSFAWINGFSKPPRHYHELNRRSMDMWPGFVAELGVSNALTLGGNLVLANDVARGEALRAQVLELQEWGYPSRLIGPNELAALEPTLGEQRFAAACYMPREGHVDVAPVVQACVARAQVLGATVMEHAGAVGLRLGTGGTIEGVETEAGVIACDVAVLAAGTETPSIAGRAGVVIPQEVSPGIVIRTEAIPRLLHSVAVVHLPAVSPTPREVHLRQLPDGTIQMGQGTQESLDRDDSQAHADDLLDRAAHYFPALRGATAVPQPVGYRPMPADGLPVLGFARSCPNLYVAMMHSGVTLAPLVGDLAALEIGDAVTVDLLTPYRTERFQS
jgi:glycine/D-amino acid oxidase-like deaminating enzyme